MLVLNLSGIQKFIQLKDILIIGIKSRLGSFVRSLRHSLKLISMFILQIVYFQVRP